VCSSKKRFSISEHDRESSAEEPEVRLYISLARNEDWKIKIQGRDKDRYKQKQVRRPPENFIYNFICDEETRLEVRPCLDLLDGGSFSLGGDAEILGLLRHVRVNTHGMLLNCIVFQSLAALHIIV
jgi:hypothetical protein